MKKTLLAKIKKILMQNRKHYAFMAGVMLVAFLVGFIFPDIFGAQIWDILLALVDDIKDLNYWEMAFFIIENNIRATGIAILLGFTVIFPLFSACLNGYIIGVVIRKTIVEDGFIVFLKFFPHGIFEIPALLIAMGMGLSIGLHVTQRIRNLLTHKKTKSKAKPLHDAFLMYVCVVIPLLIIAGFIETGLIFFLK